MAAVAAPYGLIPHYHPSGIIRPSVYGRGILSGFVTSLFKHTPIALQADGTIGLPGVGLELLGSFAGVEFTDAFGRRQHSPGWVAGTVATAIVAYVWDDPEITYRIQANGGVSLAARGDNADFVNPGAGNTTTLYSTAAISIVTGATGQLRVYDKVESVNNDWFDSDPVSGAFTDLVVKIAESQLAADFGGV